MGYNDGSKCGTCGSAKRAPGFMDCKACMKKKDDKAAAAKDVQPVEEEKLTTLTSPATKGNGSEKVWKIPTPPAKAKDVRPASRLSNNESRAALQKHVLETALGLLKERGVEATPERVARLKEFISKGKTARESVEKAKDAEAMPPAASKAEEAWFKAALKENDLEKAGKARTGNPEYDAVQLAYASAEQILKKHGYSISSYGAAKAKDEVKPVKYNESAVQKEIKKDKRIGGKGAKAIHSLLKGRTGDKATSLAEYGRRLESAFKEKDNSAVEALLKAMQADDHQPGTIRSIAVKARNNVASGAQMVNVSELLRGRDVKPVGDSTENLEHPDEYKKDAQPVGDAEASTLRKELKQLNEDFKTRGHLTSYESQRKREITEQLKKVKDVQPVGDDEDDAWKRDTDKGAAELIRKDGKTMTSAEVARKYGFSLSFVREVLGGDNQRVGDDYDKSSSRAAAVRHARELYGGDTKAIAACLHRLGWSEADIAKITSKDKTVKPVGDADAHVGMLGVNADKARVLEQRLRSKGYEYRFPVEPPKAEMVRHGFLKRDDTHGKNDWKILNERKNGYHNVTDL